MDPVAIDTNVIIAQMTLVEGLGIAIIGGVFGVVMKWQEKRRNNEREEDLAYRKRREEREQTRQKRDAALYNVVLSTARGTEVLLHQAHGDHLNGDVEHSLASIDQSISEFNKVSNEQMAKL